MTKTMTFDLMFEPVDKKDHDAFIVEETPDGYKVKYISVDNDPESPRSGDNFGTMICLHKRYILGDEYDENMYKNNFNSWDELKNKIEENEDVAVILPLYLYDHSGITMQTHPFDDIWDSGQVGFIFVSKDKVRKEFSVSDITDELIEKIKTILEGEVEVYNEYLTGNVYSLVKETFDKDKRQIDYDIVGGYYGLKYTKEELKNFDG
jgi:hypothetical protein